MKYHSCDGLFLTMVHKLEMEQSQVGSLTGAVASQRVTEAPKGTLRVDGHHPTWRVKAKECLTVRQTCRAGAKAGTSDLAVACGSAAT